MTEDPKTAVQRQWESHIAVNDGDWADQKAREILKGREYYDGEIGESDLAEYLRAAKLEGWREARDCAILCLTIDDFRDTASDIVKRGC